VHRAPRACLGLEALEARALLSANPPWYPSLLAFEHGDSARTHLIAQAQFGGSFSGPNTVQLRTTNADYPTPYNLIELGPNALFVYGGCYGDKPGGTGSFVARLDPKTFQPIWQTQLTNTAATGEWDYPGVLSALSNGDLYLIYGYRLAKIDPRDGRVLAQVKLPTPVAPRDTTYNGLDALPDGTLIAKAVYRAAGSSYQGTQGLAHADAAVPSEVVAIDPNTLRVKAATLAPEFIGARITSVSYHGKDYVYLVGRQNLYRYVYADGALTLDPTWGPVPYLKPGQTTGTAIVVMNDWIVLQTNAAPITPQNPNPTPLSVVAVNQNSSSEVFSIQPFANFSQGAGSDIYSSVSVDPQANLIYTMDSGPGRVGAVRLGPAGLTVVWTAPQNTEEYLTLIGPPGHRVLVGTDSPGQSAANPTYQYVVWRDAATGRELARSPALTPISTGSMVEPGYRGRMYDLAANGQILELAVRPARSVTGGSQGDGNHSGQRVSGGNDRSVGLAGGVFSILGAVPIDHRAVGGNGALDGAGGGGMDFRGGWTIDSSTGNGNSTAGTGGGLWSGGSLLCDASTVADNTAGAAGGGLFNAPRGHALVRGSEFRGDQAAAEGGGLWSGHRLRLLDVLFADTSPNDVTGF
jgi:hypothetical protein